MTHLSRAKWKTSQRVSLNGDVVLQTEKDVFQNDPRNMQHFIKFFGAVMTCIVPSNTTVCAESDADILVVAEVLQRMKSHITVVVRDDIDSSFCEFIVMIDYCDIYFLPSQRGNAKSVKWQCVNHKGNMLRDLCVMLSVSHSVTGCDAICRHLVLQTNRTADVEKSARLEIPASVYQNQSHV